MEKDILLLLTSFMLWFVFFVSYQAKVGLAQNNMVSLVHVGALLDLGSLSGKASQTAISLALDDFYSLHGNYTTRVVIHTRDCKQDDITAASAAIGLLKNVYVQAIIGPKTSTQSAFVVDIGNRTQVPVLSYSATSPTLSSARTPFFVRTTLNDSSQIAAITAVIKHFGWREVVTVYEDSDYGTAAMPLFVDSFQEIDARVPYRSVISSSATDDEIAGELYKLMTMQTRVFVVHMMPGLASRLFVKARDVGMMTEGYVWITTDGITDVLDSLKPMTIKAMQGVIGVRPYVRSSEEIAQFTAQFKSRFRQDNPSVEPRDPTVWQLWAYDTAWAMAAAVEKARLSSPSVWTSQIADGSNDLGRLSVSQTGPELLSAILSTRFRGLSGEFRLVNGQLQSAAFEIVNVNGRSHRQLGFWTQDFGLRRLLTSPRINDLKPVIWPGESATTPKGWQIPMRGKKLRIAVPTNTFNQFVNVERNPTTNEVAVTGYCIDIFDAVMDALPYSVPYEYIPFYDTNSNIAFSYNDMLYQVYLKNFDAVVGDTTIIANRSLYVDFTLPYTESGVAMVVPMRDDRSKSMWVFLKPLSGDLWIGIVILFLFTGFVVWAIEHRTNAEFAGTRSQQLVNISYFTFFTFLAPPRENLLHNLSKFALINWLLLAWLIGKLYDASLTSMMTVERLQPTVSDVNGLLKNGDYVGYQEGSFVIDLLKSLNFDEHKIKSYSTPDEYVVALAKGSDNGGVAAIFDEIPYIKLFLSEHYCNEYSMVGRIYKTGGFGFVFPKGSPLVSDVSRAILNVTEGDKIVGIERKWFGDQMACSSQRSSLNSAILDFQSFRGIFYITAILWGLALVIFFAVLMRKNTDKVRAGIAQVFMCFKFKSHAASSTPKEKVDESIVSDGRLNPHHEQAVGVIVTPIFYGSESPLSMYAGFGSQEEEESSSEPYSPEHQEISV